MIRPRSQRGFSLLEMAIGLVILGIVTMALWQFLGTATQQRRTFVQRDLMARADDAVMAFALINNRLPCPASDNGGREDCSLQVGRLPFRTLGLPDARAGFMRYGIYRNQGLDADLGVAKDRFLPLFTTEDGLATIGPDTQGITINGLDFCQALRTAMRAPLDAGYLHTQRWDTPASVNGNVAYALSLPGTDGFGGSQASAAPVFDSPQRPTAGGVPSYGDQVRAHGFGQVWSRMRCGDGMAAAGHAPWNALAAAGLYHQGLVEYEKQLKISDEIAGANVALALAGVASAGGAIANATQQLLEAAGAVTGSVGAASFEMGLAIAAEVASAASAAAATASSIQADIVAADTAANLKKVGTMKTDADVLYQSILAHAHAADQAGTYGNQ
jgi:prepilin-type N-terminal cleavage/methylation domain-containing protein